MSATQSLRNKESVQESLGTAHGAPVTELRQYRIFNDRLLLMSESVKTTEHVDTFLRPFLSSASEREDPTLRLAVFKAPQDHVLLCCPEAGFTKRYKDGSRAYYGFRRLFINLVIARTRAYFPLHGCCVADTEGRVAVISGISTAGKTTITAALLQRGFQFMCDDLVFFQEDGGVVSLPVGSSVSAQTVSFIPELESLRNPNCRFDTPESSDWTVHFADVFPFISPYTIMPATHLFFLSPHFGERSSLTPCSPTAAMWHFLNARMADRQLITPLAKSDPATNQLSFSVATTLAQRAHFFHVVNGDLRETADLIAEALEA